MPEKPALLAARKSPLANRIRGSLVSLALVMVGGLAVEEGLHAHGLVAGTVAHAQGKTAQVVELNRTAMRLYTQLELEAAVEKLEQALALAREGGASKSILARTYLNLATVEIAGMQSNAQGLQHCVNALETDPTIQLDPLTSTPEVMEIFALARARVEGGGASPSPGGSPGGPPPAREFVGPGDIPHTPAPEQKAWTAVPVAIEVPEDAVVGPIYVHYRGAKMNEFVRGEMVRIPGGYYGFEIPCEVVAPPTMRYYIVAYSREGEEIGHAGDESYSVEVPIVDELTYPSPSLPGHEPPAQCKPPKECAPGDEACASGNACKRDRDCDDGMTCEDKVCVPEQEEAPGEAPKFFARLGFTIGAGLARSGSPADREPRQNSDLTNGPFIDGGSTGTSCPDNQICVRVSSPGLVPMYGMTGEVGYYPWDRIGFSVFMRYQFNTGRKNGLLPPGLMLGARFLVRVAPLRATGWDANLFLGFSYGEMQIQPKQGRGDDRPFIISGLNGFQLGSTISYRFTKNVGLYATPQIMMQFPTFLFGMETTVGVEAGF